MRLRVLSLNVQHDHGDCARRTGLLNHQLRRLAPDLVALREVQTVGQRSSARTDDNLSCVTRQ